MYLPFCGIAISNAQLFSASRKEYDRSRVRATGQTRIITPHPQCWHWGWVLISSSPLAATAVGGSQSSPTWTFSLAVLGDGLAQGLVHDLNLWGNVRRCTNSCHTLICDGREHNETTAQRTEQRNEGSSLYTIWFLCACVSNWIGTAALDKGPNLLLLGETIISFYWFMVER